MGTRSRGGGSTGLVGVGNMGGGGSSGGGTEKQHVRRKTTSRIGEGTQGGSHEQGIQMQQQIKKNLKIESQGSSNNKDLLDNSLIVQH